MPTPTDPKRSTPPEPKSPKQGPLARPGLTEYAVICALIAAAALGIVQLYGDNIRRLFGMSADALAGDSNISQRGWPRVAPSNGDTHAMVAPHRAVLTAADRLSTFAIDVDTASYSYGRQALRDGLLPRPESVRVEEWVNAFGYDLPGPKEAPFGVHTALARSPFGDKALLKVSLQGRRIANQDRLPAHLVFLVDTSGSMAGEARLGLAKESMRILVGSLNPRDTVALVTYAGDTRDVLAPTPARDRHTILQAIDSLTAGGGTAMGSGMQLAYAHAVRQVQSGAVSRVLVFTDGDANIGRTGHADILEAVKDKVKEGVMLTTVGFGLGNYRAATLERLADSGNGQALYIDSRDEAVKVFGAEGVAGTLEAIAKDVKVQVELSPERVRSWRLVGYENRDVADADFKNDAVDGGELGAGHSVTALYELELLGGPGRLGTVRVHGLKLAGAGSFDVEAPIASQAELPALEDAEVELRFAAAVALAADLLRRPDPDAEQLGALVRLAAGATRSLKERSEYVGLMQGALEARWPSLARYSTETSRTRL